MSVLVLSSSLDRGFRIMSSVTNSPRVAPKCEMRPLCPGSQAKYLFSKLKILNMTVTFGDTGLPEMSSFGTVTIAERSSRPRHDLAELIALEHGWGLRVEPITRSQRGDLGPVLSSGQFDVAISIDKAGWTMDDGLPICAAKVEETVELSEPKNSYSDAEIDYETSIKTVTFPNAYIVQKL
ncbi:hypothetical protein TNCV_971801 [Trichonephila clavipes]|nr:hypothetical protein TNCV_971801 [Trichonephila clavipes]